MITYKDYKRLGYSAIPKEQFARFSVMSENALRKFSNRKFAAARGGLCEREKRGLCEICDIYHAEISGGRVSSFSNEGYREQYFEDAGVNRRVFELVQFFFPRAQLFRGV